MRRRTPRPLRALLVCALVASISGCPSREQAPVETPGAITVVDAAGDTVDLAGPAIRLISLVPSASATLHAMRAATLLVGRTNYDTQAWAEGIPSVGGGIQPSLEVIVALEPDLVVGFAGDQDPRTSARLEELGIPYLAVRPDRIEDIYETASLLGRVTGHRAAADSLISAIQAGLAETQAAVSGWPRLRVAHVLGGSPPWVTGPGTYIDEIISLVGGDNVFSDLGQLYTAITPEELRSREIDVVLVSNRGDFDEGLTPEARIEAIGSAFEIPGPDVVAAARRVAEILHGRPLR